VTVTNEFERAFQEAQRRVLPGPNNNKKPNGPMPNMSFREAARPHTRKKSGISLDDFYSYMPTHSYIYTPTCEMWPSASVNSRLSPIRVSSKRSIPASKWLDRHQSVEQMTWAPGLPTLIDDKLISDGGWIDRDGVTTFNIYRPPTSNPGDPKKALPWLTGPSPSGFGTARTRGASLTA
jgi:hypothetical protein